MPLDYFPMLFTAGASFFGVVFAACALLRLVLTTFVMIAFGSGSVDGEE